ncbi:acyl-CoA dehydrogenase [Rhodococcus pseudokoreensis]|uniref:Acyl-CoA dehydrogenase n=1 Tax=Rhodococcus pseudokoreensis TaxID=2811421 RepID=A0A974WA47_9NOCA|nr:acyl-CoA dehydrogenase family protein [Rhodococcus pseudokoreensis]QSE93003.1 acyl-CoA dehydrogenase [Rhodococcus pseudokoreensis]
MSWSSGWWGPALHSDQGDLRAMLDAFVAAHNPVLDDEPDAVAGLVTELAELGVWTLGTVESAGGGGAARDLTALALERLGRAWPALGWAAAQAHAAVDVLADDNRFADLVAQIHTGQASVAVADSVSSHVRLAFTGNTLTGSIDRVDAAAAQPYLLVLDGDDTALLVSPAAVTFTPLRRTGLGGALTRTADVDAAGDTLHELTGIDANAARNRLRLGAAAVAAGIAGAAADAAADYAADRRQFGNTLTAIPTVRQSLLYQATRSITTLGAALTAEDPVQTFAVAQQACDSAIQVAADALQSHGGYGYLAEYSAERRLRDAVSLRAAVDTQGGAVATARALVSLPPAPTALWKDVS